MFPAFLLVVTFIALQANWGDYKLIIFFLIFPRKQVLTFHAIGLQNTKKIFQYVSVKHFTHHGKNQLPFATSTPSAIAVSFVQHLATFLMVYPPPPTNIKGKFQLFTKSTALPWPKTENNHSHKWKWTMHTWETFIVEISIGTYFWYLIISILTHQG